MKTSRWVTITPATLMLLLALHANATAPPQQGQGALTPQQMAAALDDFQAALEKRWSYLQPSQFDHVEKIKAIRGRLDKLSPAEFVLELQKVIACGIDGHAGMIDVERSLPAGYLPFLVEPVGERFVAFAPDRSALLSDAHPHLESIDGRKVSDWMAAAAPFVAKGSPQYVRREKLRWLRWIQFLRHELGAAEKPAVEATLVSADGKQRRTITLNVAQRMPAYGVWPREDSKPALLAGVAYLRLAKMDDQAAQRVEAALADASKAAGIIIDVRDNGGGSRDALRALAGMIMKPDGGPRVVNAAVARLHPENSDEKMASRYLYPENWAGWTAEQRKAIEAFKKTFKPQWLPPRELYGDWHYMVLGPGGDPKKRFDKRVVILMNAKCFSATDVFLSALKGMPNVTLLGTPSGGGSANTATVTMGGTSLAVRLGTMVSFRTDGRLLDTNGVEPDTIVEPSPEFFVGGRDDQLEAAEALLAGQAQAK